MKLVHQHRTYEEHDGEWFVVHPAPTRIFRRAALLAATGLAVAAIGVIGIAAALVGLLLLPVGLLVAWLLSRANPFFNRSPRQPRN